MRKVLFMLSCAFLFIGEAHAQSACNKREVYFREAGHTRMVKVCVTADFQGKVRLDGRALELKGYGAEGEAVLTYTSTGSSMRGSLFACKGIKDEQGPIYIKWSTTTDGTKPDNKDIYAPCRAKRG